jgi:hypothetical protein
MEEIIIDVDDLGEVEVKTKGFKGRGCVKASQFIEEALGKISNMKRTAEFYAEGLTEKVKVNRGE